MYVRSFSVKYTLDLNSITHGIKRKHHNIHIDKTRSKHRGELACVNEVLHLKLALAKVTNLHKTTYVIDPNLKA